VRRSGHDQDGGSTDDRGIGLRRFIRRGVRHGRRGRQLQQHLQALFLRPADGGDEQAIGRSTAARVHPRQVVPLVSIWVSHQHIGFASGRLCQQASVSIVPGLVSRFEAQQGVALELRFQLLRSPAGFPRRMLEAVERK